MAEFLPVPSFDLVVFGASGDLALRKLFPSLFHRFKDGQIPADSRIIGVARQALTQDAFLTAVSDGFANLAGGDAEASIFQDFLKLISYVALDATKAEGDWDALSAALKDGDDKVRVFYLSTPPSVFADICARLRDAELAIPTSRVVLEKPLGRDLKSAKAINDGVAEVFSEDRVYRIDHYLGKETVQNLLVLRFANALFEPVWSRASIDHVQITVAESIGVGSRGDYYDKSGAIDRKSTRLNSSHRNTSRMPSSA